MATAAATSESYASGNSAVTPTAFYEANSSKAMASRAASSQALLMLRAFSSDQCTASDSPSTLPTPIRVSMGSWPSCRFRGSCWLASRMLRDE